MQQIQGNRSLVIQQDLYPIKQPTRNIHTVEPDNFKNSNKSFKFLNNKKK